MKEVMEECIPLLNYFVNLTFNFSSGVGVSPVIIDGCSWCNLSGTHQSTSILGHWMHMV